MDAYELLDGGAAVGQGSFGVVRRVRRKADGRVLVWKELNYGRMSEKEKALVVSEVNILRELRHPFVVRYYDRVIDKPAARLLIVMEYCAGGDLGQVLRRCRREGTFLEEAFVWRVLAQLALALKECHRHREAGGDGAVRPILHRDIKPVNVLLDSRRNAKLGDFGLAKELGSRSGFARTNVGTPFYMSPELVNDTRYDERSDIWSLGCLVYEMCARAPPFEAANQLALARKITEGRFARIPERYSDELQSAVEWMLQTEPARRPRVDDVLRLSAAPMRAAVAENSLVVREFSLQQRYAARHKELAARVRELEARERAVEARERAVEERERAVADAPPPPAPPAAPAPLGPARRRRSVDAGEARPSARLGARRRSFDDLSRQFQLRPAGGAGPPGAASKARPRVWAAATGAENNEA